MASRKKFVTKKKKSPPKEELVSYEREENLVNAPAEGRKGPEASEILERDNLDTRIPPPEENASGSRAHHIRASRGEEVGFYQIPQGGLFNNASLKS